MIGSSPFHAVRRSAFLVLLCAMAAACAQGGGGDRDAGRRDSGRRDSGRRDSGRRDAGRRDSGRRDAGRRDAATTPDGGPVRDAGGPTDAFVPRDTFVPRDAGLSACPIGPGSLSIVEVMISSRSGGGDRGEWFEIVNEETCIVNLAGLEIVSPTSGGTEKVHSVTAGTIAPGASFVFALSASPADNHNLDFDYAYGTGGTGDVILNNGADWLELRSGGAAVDRVAWPSGGFTHGHSRQFPSALPSTMNDSWARWCDSTAVYSTAGGMFYGTPGMPNAATCP